MHQGRGPLVRTTDKNLNGREERRQMQRQGRASGRWQVPQKQPIEEALACGDVEKVLASLSSRTLWVGLNDIARVWVVRAAVLAAQLAAVVCAYPEALTRQNGRATALADCVAVRGDAAVWAGWSRAAGRLAVVRRRR